MSAGAQRHQAFREGPGVGEETGQGHGQAEEGRRVDRGRAAATLQITEPQKAMAFRGLELSFMSFDPIIWFSVLVRHSND